MTPDDFTIQELMLDVGDGHKLYVQDWGNKKATIPVLFLHGGPGSGTSDRHKTSFDPNKQRVIFFDQRGAGKSLPFGSLEHNTTQDLVSDIPKILQHFDIQQCIVTGSSWGSCLGLAFALAQPEYVKALVLGGVFTGSQAEIDWLDKGGFKTFFPDVWEKYLVTIPDDQRSKFSAYHYQRLMEGSPKQAAESGYAYENLEGAVMRLDDRFKPSDPTDYDPSSIRIEMHYMAKGCFMPDRYILDNAHSLKMPVWIVQGRYDVVCPPVTAYELSKIVPNNELIWTVSGHKSERESWNVMRTILLQLSEGK